jgi:O-acetyl-ADP-ribose deacetylase (regulator of RNase III)
MGMITATNLPFFESQSQALVNPVNTMGVMGAGLALEFKKRFPRNYLAYHNYCTLHGFAVGTLFVFHENDKEIVNFPTKRDYRNPSTLEIVEQSLSALRWEVECSDWKTLSMPQIGCGLGGLEWSVVKPLIYQHLAGLPINILLHER